MIRVLNFCCFAITAFACLALYHVSEQTRVARVQLSSVAAANLRRTRSDEGS